MIASTFSIVTKSSRENNADFINTLVLEILSAVYLKRSDCALDLMPQDLRLIPIVFKLEDFARIRQGRKHLYSAWKDVDKNQRGSESAVIVVRLYKFLEERAPMTESKALLRAIQMQAQDLTSSSFISFLAPLVAKMCIVLDASEPEAQNFVLTVLTLGVEGLVGVEPARPTTWVRSPTSCNHDHSSGRDDCLTCKGLANFASDAKRRQYTIASKDMQWPYRRPGTDYRIDSGTHFLNLTKTTTVWEQQHSGWQRRALEVQEVLCKIPQELLIPYLGSKYPEVMNLDMMKQGGVPIEGISNLDRIGTHKRKRSQMAISPLPHQPKRFTFARANLGGYQSSNELSNCALLGRPKRLQKRNASSLPDEIRRQICAYVNNIADCARLAAVSRDFTMVATERMQHLSDLRHPTLETINKLRKGWMSDSMKQIGRLVLCPEKPLERSGNGMTGVEKCKHLFSRSTAESVLLSDDMILVDLALPIDLSQDLRNVSDLLFRSTLKVLTIDFIYCGVAGSAIGYFPNLDTLAVYYLGKGEPQRLCDLLDRCYLRQFQLHEKGYLRSERLCQPHNASILAKLLRHKQLDLLAYKVSEMPKAALAPNTGEDLWPKIRILHLRGFNDCGWIDQLPKFPNLQMLEVEDPELELRTNCARLVDNIVRCSKLEAIHLHPLRDLTTDMLASVLSSCPRLTILQVEPDVLSIEEYSMGELPITMFDLASSLEVLVLPCAQSMSASALQQLARSVAVLDLTPGTLTLTFEDLTSMAPLPHLEIAHWSRVLFVDLPLLPWRDILHRIRLEWCRIFPKTHEIPCHAILDFQECVGSYDEEAPPKPSTFHLNSNHEHIEYRRKETQRRLRSHESQLGFSKVWPVKSVTDSLDDGASLDTLCWTSFRYDYEEYSIKDLHWKYVPYEIGTLLPSPSAWLRQHTV